MNAFSCEECSAQLSRGKIFMAYDRRFCSAECRSAHFSSAPKTRATR